MAKKASAGTKSSSQTKKAAPPKKEEKKIITEVKTLEEAKKLVESEYKRVEHLTYTVLSNGHVFYGINNRNAQRVAENYGLKFFEVKF